MLTETITELVAPLRQGAAENSHTVALQEQGTSNDYLLANNFVDFSSYGKRSSRGEFATTYADIESENTL